jgi:hypothetical protein
MKFIRLDSEDASTVKKASFRGFLQKTSRISYKKSSASMYSSAQLAQAYRSLRRPDRDIEYGLRVAFSGCDSMVNVGAGTGSYEATLPCVLAVEPSSAMIRQRISTVQVVKSSAERLPLSDGFADGSMAIMSVHHWRDCERGLLELKRISRKRVVVVSVDPVLIGNSWLISYFPDVIEIERKRNPSVEWMEEILGKRCDRYRVKVRRDSSDLFLEACLLRPEMYLDARVRMVQSAWASVDNNVLKCNLNRLRHDLDQKTWSRNVDKQFLDSTVESSVSILTWSF